MTTTTVDTAELRRLADNPWAEYLPDVHAAIHQAADEIDRLRETLETLAFHQREYAAMIAKTCSAESRITRAEAVIAAARACAAEVPTSYSLSHWEAVDRLRSAFAAYDAHDEHPRRQP